MLFNSFIFLIFLSIVLPIFFSLNSKYKKIFLLAASYIFYGYWDWRFTFLLAFSTIVDFYVGAKISSISLVSKKKYFLLISLFSNLGILGFFKYYNFFTDSFQNMANSFGYNLDYLHLNIILPVGISFYTFQTLSYTIDIYRNKLKPTNSFLDFALFVSFFPQLVAGPIERASHLLPQIAKLSNPKREQIKTGFTLITIGMVKKILIGDTAGRIVDQIFASPNIYDSPELMMGVVLFALQVYNDFSGYSHIARGTAKLLGIELMENFQQPLLSSNITEFWQRWHISLSSWLKDYLYIPLGGNRKGKKRTYINLLITMLLGGLWHGANWTFVVWGGLHGIFLAVHKFMLGQRKPVVRFVWKTDKSRFHIYLMKVIVTNFLFLFSLLFFRSKSFEDAFYILGQFISWVPSEFTSLVFSIIFAYLILSFVIDIFEYITRDHAFIDRFNPAVKFAIVIVSWFYCLVYLFQATPMPFVYFQF